MNKEEFLATLRSELSGYDPAQIEDLLSDYEEHFVEGKANKRSEEEIAQKLGDPKMIAREYKTADLVKKAEEKPTTSNVFRALFAFVGLGFFNLVFVFGPFVGAMGLLFGLLMAAIAMVVAGVVSAGSSFILPFIPGIELGTHPAAVFFVSISISCFGALMGIGVFALSRWFLKLTLQYIRFNLSIINDHK